MEARNRTLPEWFERIRTRQISLPRFQRMEAWGPNEVSGLLTTLLCELPAGATLILEVGDQLPFVHRPMVDAPLEGDRITELLLDGQQRLTSIWRAMHDKYNDRTYLVKFEDDPYSPGNKIPVVHGQARWQKNGTRYPAWVDKPKELWERDCIPVRLLRPGDISGEIDQWVEAVAGEDYKLAKEIDRKIGALREKVTKFNLPFLSLPPATPKEVALDVFIKMNTSAVTLSTFDILVAQVEAHSGQSLHALVQSLLTRTPAAAAYDLPSSLVLDTAALMQDYPPTQSGYWKMNLPRMVTEWESLVDGIKGMVTFMEGESVYDAARLPTDAVLAVIAALQPHLPTSPDALGNAKILLRKYLWRSFLTNRYEQSAATAALNDFRSLRKVLLGQAAETAVPAFDEVSHPLPSTELLISAGWPKNRIILSRGILGMAIKCSARDIADDAIATREHLPQREYHHLFPDAVLRSAEIPDEQIFCALNCALISWRSNRTISCKDPLVYLRERAEANTLGEEDLQRRLRTHLVPYKPLAVAGYESLAGDAKKETIRKDYRAFVEARAAIIKRAVDTVCSGRELDASSIFAGNVFDR